MRAKREGEVDARMVSLRSPPTAIPATPMSQPLMTSPRPRVKFNCERRRGVQHGVSQSTVAETHRRSLGVGI